ncbi:hypothetical protein N9B73_11335 [Verrucomicrobiales bacterium]|jgi:hypothetical protein|nr:hypothetical protein [Verrucomicrobiales bacterium]
MLDHKLNQFRAGQPALTASRLYMQALSPAFAETGMALSPEN